MKVELFDRYVHQVGLRLPHKLRADVEVELHSLLMDALQDRMAERGTEGKAALEADQVAILEEFGPPAEVAARYAPPRRYLIGPGVFDLYALVVAVTVGSQTLLYLLLFALTIWGEAESASSLVSSFGGLLGSYLGFVFTGFGAVTLTFAILERVLPGSAFAGEEAETTWDPRTLPEVEDLKRLETGHIIAESSFLVIVLLIFNLFPDVIPLLSPDFFTTYLPLLNVAWILSIVLNIVLLRQGRWQRITRLADSALKFYQAFIFYQIVTGPPILTILSGLIRVCFAIGMLITIGEAIHKLYLVFRGDSRAVPGLSDEVAAR